MFYSLLKKQVESSVVLQTGDVLHKTLTSCMHATRSWLSSQNTDNTGMQDIFFIKRSFLQLALMQG